MYFNSTNNILKEIQKVNNNDDTNNMQAKM